jgi:hypothetical protein
MQGTPHGRFCIYFIDVLFAHHCSIRHSQNKKRDDGRQTWPPGPELREKAMSTAALGIGHPLKRVNQSRAAAASFEVARFERGGGVGSDVAARRLWSVLICRAARTTSPTRGLDIPARTSKERMLEEARSIVCGCPPSDVACDGKDQVVKKKGCNVISRQSGRQQRRW